MEKTIEDPAIPYIGPIYEGKFVPGKMVKIQGVVPQDARRFNIHLQCGSRVAPRDDVAIRVTLRFMEGCISVNSLENTTWGREQRDATLPVNRGEKFKIILTCDTSQYLVAINGQHCYEFPQRIPYHRISYLTIDGDIVVNQISYELPQEALAKAKRAAEKPQKKYSASNISKSLPQVYTDPLPDVEPLIPRRLSYEAAIYGSEASYGYQEVSIIPSGHPEYARVIKAPKVSTAPYPTNGSNMPQSEKFKTEVAKSAGPPYPTNGANKMPQPEKVEKPKTPSPAPKTTSDSVSVPVPDGDAPQVKDTECQRCCSNFCGLIVGGAFILFFVLLYQ